ncbi:MAG: TetR/AcrR family transcriptional regulator [Rhodoplanes sp.]|nr:TetR/AcrR family transcriptional regulator [Rhodoplanes sp.]NVO15196.1 TetR/AcrR family transcriptional regulator [Rhodoplanes sp.]
MGLGRPRGFDMDEALDRALQVFWRRGYEGASVAELTHAIGINPPSLYAAFGNKEGLFRKVLERYVAVRTKFWDDALATPSPRDMVERLLHGTADFMTEACNPPGCMLVRGTIACSDMAQDVHQELIGRRREGERRLCERLMSAKAAGELPDDLDPADFARFVATVLEGMSIHAAGGASRDDLHKIAATAMRAWPV